MGATGLVGLGGGAPVPDAERVAAIRFTILDDADTCAGFAEPQRAALADLNARAHLALGSNGYSDCRAQLARLRAGLDALDATRLEPRRGLAGLFDGRGKRLKAFRAAYTSAVPLASETAADIARRGREIASRGQALDDLWAETRDAVAELDAHIVAARAWLVDQDAEDATPSGAPGLVSDPVSATDQSSTTAPLQAHEHDGPVQPGPDQPEAPEALPVPIQAVPHPLQARLDDLVAVRSAGVATLPVLRAIQNAEHGLPAGLSGLPDAIETWRLDWRDALGLAGKRARKVRPDPKRLDDMRRAAGNTVEAVDAAVGASLARWSELESRLQAPGATQDALAGSQPSSGRLPDLSERGDGTASQA